jgi:glycosyltransferase involved in cell wall biosynthesis
MSERPTFSVVLPTFGRGRDIAPTIESVLRQSFGDFELIVVGDGCADETEHTVRSFSESRVAWRNLQRNTGSQSFPNNEGIKSSRGHWIAYVGHDDIWSHDHLAHMARTIEACEQADVAVSGCIYHGPQGSRVELVTGLFDSTQAADAHFFPPTAIAHRRLVTDRIGAWRDPRLLRAPVDADFLLRAHRAKLQFVSTGKVTAHKFAAGHRYLSYLRRSGDEQRAFLRALEAGDVDVERIVAAAKRAGHFMTTHLMDYSGYVAGSAFERNRQNKGISLPALQPLHGCVVIKQSDEARGLDWHGLEREGNKAYRWSGPSPCPKILIPYTGDRARLSIEVISGRSDARLDDLQLFVETERADIEIVTVPGELPRLVGEISLKADDYTVLTLHAPTYRPVDLGISQDTRRLGIAVADIELRPA